MDCIFSSKRGEESLINLTFSLVLIMVSNPKTVYLVCHGQSMHDQFPSDSKEDPVLSLEGENQARNISLSTELQNVDLVVSSPLSRAIKTVEIAWGSDVKCMISHLHTEAWSGPWDQGVSKLAFSRKYQYASQWEGFDELPDNWSPTAYSDSDWKKIRVPAFIEFLQLRPESKIAVVGHSTFFAELWNQIYGQDIQFCSGEWQSLILYANIHQSMVEYETKDSHVDFRKNNVDYSTMKSIQSFCNCMRTSTTKMIHKAKEELSTFLKYAEQQSLQTRRNTQSTTGEKNRNRKCQNRECQKSLDEGGIFDNKEGDFICSYCGLVDSSHRMYEGSLPVYEDKIDPNSHGSAPNEYLSVSHQLMNSARGSTNSISQAMRNIERMALVDIDERKDRTTHLYKDKQVIRAISVYNKAAHDPRNMFSLQMMNRATKLFAFKRNKEVSLQPIGKTTKTTRSRPLDDTLNQHIAISWYAAWFETYQEKYSIFQRTRKIDRPVVWEPLALKRRRLDNTVSVTSVKSPKETVIKRIDHRCINDAVTKLLEKRKARASKNTIKMSI